MNRIAPYWLISCLVIWPENSFAYRPFDSTDAAVAIEIRAGLTFAISPQNDAVRRSMESARH